MPGYDCVGLALGDSEVCVFMSVILIFDVKKVFNDRSSGRIVKIKHILKSKKLSTTNQGSII